MLLTILNLPYYVKHDDIKALVQSKCGIEDIILDNILPHQNNCKKVTVGLAGPADAAVVMRKLNGQFMDGNQLQVVTKTKNQQSSSNRSPAVQSAMPSLMQNFGQYGPNWSQGPNFGPNFGQQGSNSGPQGPNFNQQGPNFGQQGPNFGQPGSNAGQSGPNFTQQGQNYGQQGSSSGQQGSNFGQQGQNFGQQASKYNPQGPYYSSEKSRLMNQHYTATVPPLLGYNPMNVMAMYANPSAYLMNQSAYQNQPNTSNSNMGYQTFNYDDTTNQKNKEDLLPRKRVNQPQQSGGDTKWGNNREAKRGKWDNNRDSRWDDSRDLGWESNRRNEGDNNRGSRWESGRGSSWNDNRQQDWGNDRDLKMGNNNEPGWGNGRDSKRGNGNDQEWDNNRGSKWDNNRDQKRDSRFSKWERTRDLDRESSRPNQFAGKSSRGHDSSYGNDQNFSRSSFENNNQNQKQGTNSSGKTKKQRYTLRKKTDRNDSTADNQSPAAKRARFPDGKDPGNNTQPDGSSAAIKIRDVKVPPTDGGGRHLIYNAKMKRAQLAELYAKIVSTDMGFEYEVSNRRTLKAELKRALAVRMDKCFKANYNISLKQMKKIYSKKYDKNTHWVILRDTLKLLGGKMISKYDNAAAQEAARLRKAKPQKAPLVSGYVYGNLKVDHRFAPRGGANTSQQQKQPGQKKQKSIPLAEIPGRIPYYPQGDKKLFKAQKKQNADLYKTDPTIVLKSFKPELKTALEEETDQLSKVVLDECEDSDPENASFFEELKSVMPDQIKKILKLNVVRRIKPEEPFVVRLYSKPQIKREPLEKFLVDSKFNVTCLRRLKNKNYYVANCETVDDHDRLCLMGPMKVGMSSVTIRPFQMAGIKDRITKTDIAKQRRDIKLTQIKHSDKLIDICLERPYQEPDNTVDSDYEDKIYNKEELTQEKEPAGETTNAEVNIKNKDEDQKPEFLDATEETAAKQTIKKEKNVSPIKSCETKTGYNIKTELASEAKIENVMDKINEETACSPIIQDREGDGTQMAEGDAIDGGDAIAEGDAIDEGDPNDEGRSESEIDNKVAPAGDIVNQDDAVDDIDFADVNEDDLEDW